MLLRFVINFVGLIPILAAGLTTGCNYVHAGYSKPIPLVPAIFWSRNTFQLTKY